MSGPQDHSIDNVVGIRPSEAEVILKNLRSLRDHVVTAWCERGVVLSQEEQAELHAEIKRTCDFLTDLTRHP